MIWPFHMIWSSGVRMILFLSVLTMLLLGLGEGKSMLTEFVIGGSVMMSMTRRTSMTSISGVTFISIIGEPSSLPPDIAMGRLLLNVPADPSQPTCFGLEMKPTVG